jgi:hypothetical protein
MELLVTLGYYAIIIFTILASISLIDLIFSSLFRFLRLNILFGRALHFSGILLSKLIVSVSRTNPTNYRIAKAFVAIANLLIFVKKYIQ